MEATAVSVGKAVLDGVVGYAKSAVAEEVALQLGVEHDVGFVADELEMMQSFMMTADEEGDQNNKVLNTWVKQVRNVAYNVEDSLVDFEIHAEREKPPLMGCIPRNPCDRRRVAMEVKELKAKVEEVSSRNLRYRLIKDGAGGSKLSTVAVEQHGIAGAAALFGMDEAWRATSEQKKSKVDLAWLIIGEAAEELRVIAVWGTSGDLGKTSEIRKAYNDPASKAKYVCRAWVRLMHPFNPMEFIQSTVRQFYINCSEEHCGADVLLKMDEMGQSDLIREFKEQVSSNSYLIVIDGVVTIDEWDCIRAFFPDKRNGSRVIVATQQIEIASLCTEQPYQVSELKQLSSDQIIYLFHKKEPMGCRRSKMEEYAVRHCCLGSELLCAIGAMLHDFLCSIQVLLPPSSGSRNRGRAHDTRPRDASPAALVEMPEKVSANSEAAAKSSSVIFTDEIEEEGEKQPNGALGRDFVPSTTEFERQFNRSKTRAIIIEDFIIGRTTEKHKIIDLVSRSDSSHCCKVISVWGMGGIGKTTLVRSVYRSQEIGDWKRAWVTVQRPFNHEVLLRYLALQLEPDSEESSATAAARKRKNIGSMENQDMISELSRLLETQKCLIVVDDLSSTAEWDAIKHYLTKAGRIIATTREKLVAKHCSGDEGNMFSLKGLDDDDALDLFKKKVFKDAPRFDMHTGMLDQAKHILKKCDGLPLAISTIGGYLANKPKTTMEWKKLNDGISAELEINWELRTIRTVLLRSYDGLPYHLKTCFLYLSVFPEDHVIKRKHVIRRWIAEGFSREMQRMTAEQVGEKHFDNLLDRSMTLPLQEKTDTKVDSCQLHDLIREICVSKAREENLVFTLEEGCSMGGAQGTIRHLAISSNWKRDKDVMQRMLDLSHMRSLTVFGEWRSFFISNKTRFLRVLDLEQTVGLRDHHLDQIMELLHLRYLSLRRCVNILKLPDSLANLRQLQTLDVRNTLIWTLPMTITSLQKLQYLRASGRAKGKESNLLYNYGLSMNYKMLEMEPYHGYGTQKILCNQCIDMSKSLRYMGRVFWRPRRLEDRWRRTSNAVECVTRHDICNMCCYLIQHKKGAVSVPNRMVWGAGVPFGISKMAALRTLCDVSVERGNAIFQELRELTQLHKLGVTGVTTENAEKFWHAISGHSQLRSLSVKWAWKNTGLVLDDCLGETLWPPKCLESLKMLGKLTKLTEWIHRLQNLSKLQLVGLSLNQDAVRAIGLLPDLEVLFLELSSVESKRLCIPRSSFRSLLVLELRIPLDIQLEFEQEAMPKLELLEIRWCKMPVISGLQFLASLKEIRVDDISKESVQRKLAEYPNNVTLKVK